MFPPSPSGLQGLLQVCTGHSRSRERSFKSHGLQSVWPRAFGDRSAENGSELTAGPVPGSVRNTRSFLEPPAAFLLLSSSPSLADKAAVRLQVSPPEVDAQAPHVLLSELFPGQRSFLPEPSPAHNTIKAAAAHATLYYFSKWQNAPYSPFQAHIFCLHLSLFAEAWDRWLSTTMFGLEQSCP